MIDNSGECWGLLFIMEFDSLEKQYLVSDEEIHLRDYLLVLSKRKWIILLVLVLAVLIAAVKTFTTIPYYTAFSAVLLEKNSGLKGLENRFVSNYDPDFLETQSVNHQE